MAAEKLWQVVVNHEEQWHGILPQGDKIPAGCQAVGRPRTREACLRYVIEEVWTDMRPLQIRRLR